MELPKRLPTPFARLIISIAAASAIATSIAHADEPPTFGPPIETGTVIVPGLVEASGIVASRKNPDVFWTHNDKGGTARVFAFGIDGVHLGTYRLPGAAAVDYEDMTVGAGPVDGIDYIYVGDMGDGNKAPARATIQIYRFPEPAVYRPASGQPVEVALSGMAALFLRYPDGPRNAETLMMDPLSGDLYIVPLRKAPEFAGVYRATREQLLAGGTITMERVGSVDFDVASGGDISPTGREIAIRQERFARIWTRAPGQSVADALAAPYFDLPIVGKPVEKNGEAIAFDPEGRGYYTLSDSLATQPLRYFPRTSAYTSPAQSTLIEPGSSWDYMEGGTMETEPTPLPLGATARRFSIGFDGERDHSQELHLRFAGEASVFVNDELVASANADPSLSTAWQTLRLPEGSIADGENGIAIEITPPTNAAEGSFYFDARLTSTLQIASSSTQITSVQRVDQTLHIEIESTLPSVMLQGSSDLVGWEDLHEIAIPAGQATHEAPLPNNTSIRYFRILTP